MPKLTGMKIVSSNSNGECKGEQHFEGPNRENDVKLFISRLTKEGKPRRNAKYLSVKDWKRIDKKDKIIIEMVYY